MIAALRLRLVPWPLLFVAVALNLVGLLFVASATYDATASHGLGREARLQLIWSGVALASALAAGHITLGAWKQLAPVLYVGGLLLVLMMIAAAGTSLVPTIKGQANWIVLGPLRVQPVELIKLSTLLACARVISTPGFEPRRFSHVLLALSIGGLPALILAKDDLGSALTFPALVFGMLFVAGMRMRHLTLLILFGLTVVIGGVAMLPKEGSKAYQYKRVQAWLHPDEYALTEGYQTQRSMSSIGSGQWLGKGYSEGDQNRLGWVPEKHTDLIFAVIGEEVGFLGSALIELLLFVGLGWAGVYAASQCRDPCGRLVVAGYLCLVTGQAAINLAVATGLMPVTGVTLPFISYGGSSLLGTWLGFGICISACQVVRRESTISGGGRLSF